MEWSDTNVSVAGAECGSTPTAYLIEDGMWAKAGNGRSIAVSVELLLQKEISLSG